VFLRPFVHVRLHVDAVTSVFRRSPRLARERRRQGAAAGSKHPAVKAVARLTFQRATEEKVLRAVASRHRASSTAPGRRLGFSTPPRRSPSKKQSLE
jgi:hypothetical protein